VPRVTLVRRKISLLPGVWRLVCRRVTLPERE